MHDTTVYTHNTISIELTHETSEYTHDTIE